MRLPTPGDERAAVIPTQYVRRVVACAASLYGVADEDLFGRDRRLSVTEPRMLSMWALRQRGWQLVAIAQAFGRDHSTVSNAVSKIERRLRVDPRLREIAELVSGVPLAEPSEVTSAEAALVAIHEQRSRLDVLEAAVNAIIAKNTPAPIRRVS